MTTPGLSMDAFLEALEASTPQLPDVLLIPDKIVPALIENGTITANEDGDLILNETSY